jgi:hypothetical protein
MNRTTRQLILAAAVSFAATLNAATVNVTAGEAEEMRDVRVSHADDEKGLEIVLDQFRDHLKRSAKRYLAEDQTLDIHFTDIDLAGEFEPWHGSPMNDIRWVKSIYIPRLEFDYTISNADGTVVAEGSEKLSDTSFQLKSTFNNSQSNTYYEREMLDDWMRQFRTKAKG